MLKRYMTSVLILAASLAFASAVVSTQAPPKAGQAIAKPAGQAAPAVAAKGPRPERFAYKPLVFTPPKAADFRTTLSNGMVVYIVEDHEIPWFQAALLSPLASGGGGGFGGRGLEAQPQRPGGGGGGGSVNAFLEPRSKLGLAALTAGIMRSGGTTSMTVEQLNERMDFLAGNVSATSLSIHMRSLDEGLKIWMDILENPAFPDDRLRREKEGIMMGIRNRNRNIGTVATRTYPAADLRGRLAGHRRGDRGHHRRHRP